MGLGSPLPAEDEWHRTPLSKKCPIIQPLAVCDSDQCTTLRHIEAQKRSHLTKRQSRPTAFRTHDGEEQTLRLGDCPEQSVMSLWVGIGLLESTKAWCLPAAQNPEVVAKIEAYLKNARTESEQWPIKAAQEPAEKKQEEK